MGMPLKSDTKAFSLDMLTSTFYVLNKVTVHASTSDARLIESAARVLIYCRDWTRSTRVTDQSYAKEGAFMLLQAAEGQTIETRFTRAVLAYANALARYASCDYNAANKYAQMAKDIL